MTFMTDILVQFRILRYSQADSSLFLFIPISLDIYSSTGIYKAASFFSDGFSSLCNHTRVSESI